MISIFKKKTGTTKHLADARDAGARSFWKTPPSGGLVQNSEPSPNSEGVTPPNSEGVTPEFQVTATDRPASESIQYDGAPNRPDESVPSTGTAGHSRGASAEDGSAFENGSQSSPASIQPRRMMRRPTISIWHSAMTWRMAAAISSCMRGRTSGNPCLRPNEN